MGKIIVDSRLEQRRGSIILEAGSTKQPFLVRSCMSATYISPVEYKGNEGNYKVCGVSGLSFTSSNLNGYGMQFV